MSRLLFFFGLLIPLPTWAYPQFIGYKYSSCITCHYNSQGNGPINDYGRALWATEIAGRMGAENKTDDQLGEASGVLGKKNLPYWIRPGFKLRQLWANSNPGTDISTSREILMQAEGSLALFLDQSQKYAVVGSFGYVPEPLRLQGRGMSVDTWISREHYVRAQAMEDLWVYAGMTDKVYGIRHANHTAFSRSRTGLAQNDQAHGVVAHYIKPNWELAANAFVGNLYQDAPYRQQGLSLWFEYEIKENWRLGTSILKSKNDFVNNLRLGFMSRVGYGSGTAVLFESGLIKDSPTTGNGSRTGYYVYSEAHQRVARGYHVFVTGQAYKADITGAHSDSVTLGFGLLAFPMQRVELRIEAENSQSFSSDPEIQRYFWNALGQLHISL
ncbi:MAG: hypothetical protein M9899_08660 [Bdellovibrionaceae bacterium]|nr:hypothetical protein [Pseudobdellovibrionaceae bacterium]